MGFTDGTFDSVTTRGVEPGHGLFTLQLDDGETFPLLVYVGPDLTVCNFF